MKVQDCSETGETGNQNTEEIGKGWALKHNLKYKKVRVFLFLLLSSNNIAERSNRRSH